LRKIGRDHANVVKLGKQLDVISYGNGLYRVPINNVIIRSCSSSLECIGYVDLKDETKLLSLTSELGTWCGNQGIRIARTPKILSDLKVVPFVIPGLYFEEGTNWIVCSNELGIAECRGYVMYVTTTTIMPLSPESKSWAGQRGIHIWELPSLFGYRE
jgi:hypothetical protein